LRSILGPRALENSAISDRAMKTNGSFRRTVFPPFNIPSRGERNPTAQFCFSPEFRGFPRRGSLHRLGVSPLVSLVFISVIYLTMFLSIIVLSIKLCSNFVFERHEEQMCLILLLIISLVMKCHRDVNYFSLLFIQQARSSL
jgi:hypothetical protein